MLDTLLRIVAETDRWVVVDKPVGLLSVPGRGEHKRDSVVTRVLELYPTATGSISVHRLDQDTSGLLVLALNPAAHRSLSRQFMHRKTGKRYEAILDGEVEGESGAVELPLVVDWPNRPRQMVSFEHGRPARTLWRVTAREPGRTRVELRPETGRTHQLRVHAATPRAEGGIGAAILGDPLYTRPVRAERLMLHAAMLAFFDPLTGEWLKFESPAPF